MAVIVDVMREERDRLQRVIEIYSSKGEKRLMERIPSMEKDIRLLNYLLKCYDDYEENEDYEFYEDSEDEDDYDDGCYASDEDEEHEEFEKLMGEI